MHSLNEKDGTDEVNHGRNDAQRTDKSVETAKKIISANSGNTHNQTETNPDDYQHQTNDRNYQNDSTVEERMKQSVTTSTGETIHSEVNEKCPTYEDKSGNIDGKAINSKAFTELQQLTDKITGNDSSNGMSDNSETSNKTQFTGAQVELVTPQDMVEYQEDVIALLPNTIKPSKYMMKSEVTVELSHHTLPRSNGAVENSKDKILDSFSSETKRNIAIKRQNQKNDFSEDGKNVDTFLNELCLDATIAIEAEEHSGELKEGDEVVPTPKLFNLGLNTAITNSKIGDPISHDSKVANLIDEPEPEPSAEMHGLTTPITIDTIRDVSGSLKDDDGDDLQNKIKKVKHTRIVMIGITGCGKSATGNSLLGKKMFKTSVGSTSMTSTCEHGRREFEDRILDVVDTPGLYDTDRSEENVKRELARCICMLSPGPHAFLIVIRVGRFNEQEQKTVESLVNFFGEDGFLKYSIVIVTRKDELEYEETTLEKFVNDSPPALKQIINQCGGRCFAVNNRLRDKNKMENQTKKLISLIDDMVKSSGGTCYTHSLFAEVEKERQKKLDEEKKRIEEIEKLKLEKEREILLLEKEMEKALREKEREIEMERKARETLERELEWQKRERELERDQDMKIEKAKREFDQQIEMARKEREQYEKEIKILSEKNNNQKSSCILS